MIYLYSFCLEDNHCSGVDPKYDCENYGDQAGINKPTTYTVIIPT